jgi:hypothetical protein
MKSSQIIKSILTNKYLALAFRLYIGAIFIYASMYKINYTAEFAETIASYQLAPYWMINFLAIVMPWLELISGVLLVVGIKSKTATAAIAGMLAIFSAVIFLSLVRDIPIGCGCFSSIGEPMSWTTVLRDLVWLAMTIQIYFFDSLLQLERGFITSIEDA